MSAGFTWRDGERLIRFGPGLAGDAARLVEEAGFDDYTLLSTERALAGSPRDLAEGAAAVLDVPFLLATQIEGPAQVPGDQECGYTLHKR